VEGLENIPDKGGVLIASNHLTNFDVFVLQMVILRPLFFMAKSELHKNPILDAFLRNMGAFPVNRGQKDQWALQHAKKVLENHLVLAMFPEGTRSKGRGLRPGKTGAARIAIQTNSPIIPVSVEGTQKLFQSFPRRTPINIFIHSPICPNPDHSILGLTDQVMFTIAETLPSELKGVYTKKPIGFNTITPAQSK
jgi:1-acyl-sn-glycerol-3-phosphate acyltransferase